MRERSNNNTGRLQTIFNLGLEFKTFYVCTGQKQLSNLEENIVQKISNSRLQICQKLYRRKGNNPIL